MLGAVRTLAVQREVGRVLRRDLGERGDHAGEHDVVRAARRSDGEGIVLPTRSNRLLGRRR